MTMGTTEEAIRSTPSLPGKTKRTVSDLSMGTSGGTTRGETSGEEEGGPTTEEAEGREEGDQEWTRGRKSRRV